MPRPSQEDISIPANCTQVQARAGPVYDYYDHSTSQLYPSYNHHYNRLCSKLTMVDGFGIIIMTNYRDA